MPLHNKLFVGEVKMLSPFGFKSNYNCDQLIELAAQNADIVSIHIDPLWGGSSLDIDYVKMMMMNPKIPKKPILAKGLHTTDDSIKQSFDRGADYVLVVGRIPKLDDLSKIWLEPLTEEQFKPMLEACPNAVVFNHRDLSTGAFRIISFSGPEVNEQYKPLLIQASGIKSFSHVKEAYGGFIVGEHLPQFILDYKVQALKEFGNG